MFPGRPVARAAGHGKMRLHRACSLTLCLVGEHKQGARVAWPLKTAPWSDDFGYSHHTPFKSRLLQVRSMGQKHRVPWELIGDAESQSPLDLRIPDLHFDKIPGDSYSHWRRIPDTFSDPQGQGPVVSTDLSLERPQISGLT